MIDATLTNVLLTTFTYGLCGAVVGMISRIINRRQEGPRVDQATGIGFLIGAAFGAFFGVFQSLLIQTT